MATTIFITATGAGTWEVPAGVTSIDVGGIAGGGGGWSANSVENGAAGGGGGAYARVATLSVTASTTLYYSVGSGASPNTTTASTHFGGDTWLNKSSNAAPGSSSDGILAKGGQSGYGFSGYGVGGSAASCVGTTTSSGGSSVSTSVGGSGGGGAGGPSGNGAAGGTGNWAGGGGGGADNGSAGSAAGGDFTGGNGGAGSQIGSTGGSGAATAVDGGDGTLGGGGGGGYGPDGTAGGDGGTSTIWTQTSDSATSGPGGGGGGSGMFGSTNPIGGNGGIGGGGGGGHTGGSGGNGIIVITYESSVTAAYGGAFGAWAYDCGVLAHHQQKAAVDGFAGFVYAAESPQPSEPTNFFGAWETPIPPIWLRTATGGTFDDFGQNVESAEAETPVFVEWPIASEQRFVTPHDFSSFVHQQAPPVYCFDAFWQVNPAGRQLGADESNGWLQRPTEIVVAFSEWRDCSSVLKNSESFQDFAAQIALPEEAVYGGSFGEWWSVPQSASLRGEGAHEFGSFEQTQPPPPPPPYGAISENWPPAFFQAQRGCDFWSFVIEGAVIETPAVDVDGVYRPRKPVKRTGPKPDYSIYNRPTLQPAKKEPVRESVEEEGPSVEKAEAKAPFVATPGQPAKDLAPPKKAETILAIDVALPGLGVKASNKQEARPSEKPQAKGRLAEKQKTKAVEENKESSDDDDKSSDEDDEVIIRLISEKVEILHKAVRHLLAIHSDLVGESQEILELLKED